jgi:nickel transport protein
MYSILAKSVFVSINIFLTLNMFCSSALAHRVNLFAWYDGKMIMAEGYFSSGKKAVNSTILVFDSKGKEVFHGITDKKGEFSFKPPQTGDYRLVLEAGMGHRAEALISVKDIKSPTGELEAEQAGLRIAEGNNEPGKGLKTAEDANKRIIALKSEEFEEILDRKLNPIKEQLFRLAEQGNRVNFRDVFAGLGYIAGLMGLAIYLAQRKHKK